VVRNVLNTYRIPSPTDAQILRFCRSFLSAPDRESTANVVVQYSPYLTRTYKTADELEQDKDKIKEHQSSIPRVVFNLEETPQNGTANCTFERSITDGSVTIPSQYEAEFHFNDKCRNAPPEIPHRLTEEIADFKRTLLPHSNGVTSGNSILEKHFADLSSLVVSITDTLAKSQVDFDMRLKEQQEKLRSDALESEERREKAHSEAIDALNQKSRQLEEQRAELDLRRARDARRKLREDITNDLKLRLTKKTNKWSTYVYRGGVVLISLFLAFSGVYFASKALGPIAALTETSSSTQIVFAYLRFFICTGAAAVFGFYAMSYLKKNASDDMQFERDLERYALDVDRASWAIETVMEFKDEEDGLTVPDLWLQGATAKKNKNKKIVKKK